MRVAFDFLGGGLRPPSEPPPIDSAGKAGARTQLDRSRHAHAHSVTSLCRCAWHSISSEGGCAPLPNLPPSIAPAKPALERSSIAPATLMLTASLPCADARGIRFPRRGAAPPFRTSPHRWRRQSRRPNAARSLPRRSCSQRHFLVPMRVAFDGHGDGERCDMARVREDVDAERRGVAPVALRADAQTVGPREQLLLQPIQGWI